MKTRKSLCFFLLVDGLEDIILHFPNGVFRSWFPGFRSVFVCVLAICFSFIYCPSTLFFFSFLFLYGT